MDIGDNVSISTFPNESIKHINASYFVKKTADIACIYVMSDVPMKVEALGGGSHPSVLLVVEDATYIPFDLIFNSFNEKWVVFSAFAEKSGISVTLINQE